MADVGTWRRVTNEPLETKVTFQTSHATVAALRRRAGEQGISATELVRALVLEGLERLDDENSGGDR
jgi:hypothetical protein